MISKKYGKILGSLLLGLLAGYMLCISLFTHSHKINGYTITHSHPYSQAPDTGNHTHTTAEFIAIAHLSAVLMIVAACCAIAGPAVRSYRLPRIAAFVRIDRAELHTVPHRGPPAVC